MANKVRIKFTKEDKMRFIGHLDLLNLFQRAMKRAGVPIGYSQGFNPHQLMAFALPLSLGMASVGEYVDVGLDAPMDMAQMKDALNQSMPMGIKVLGCRPLAPEEKGAAASICAALYHVTMPPEVDFAPLVGKVLEAQQVMMMKKSKTQNKEVDIRPDIFSLDMLEPNKMAAMVAAGSNQNLKPDLLVAHMVSLLDEPLKREVDVLDFAYCRMDMFQISKGEWVVL